VDNKQQAKQAISTVAERLANMERGEAARRLKNKEAAHEQWRREYKELQRRYKRDPQAVIAERTWTCPYCGTVYPPTVHANPVEPDSVFVLQKDECGCEGERAARETAEQEEKAEHSTYAQMQRKAVLKRAGLLGDLEGYTFERFEAPLGSRQYEWKRQVEDYCEKLLAKELGEKCWLVLWGPYGTGKSHLAASVLHRTLDAGLASYFRVWPEWMDMLRNSFGSGNTEGLLNELKMGHVVAVDDIDKQHPTESGFAEERLYVALNDRYNNNRPTILTFNRKPMEMEPWMGGAVVDRVIGSAYAILECGGSSWRSTKVWS